MQYNLGSPLTKYKPGSIPSSWTITLVMPVWTLPNSYDIDSCKLLIRAATSFSHGPASYNVDEFLSTPAFIYQDAARISIAQVPDLVDCIEKVDFDVRLSYTSLMVGRSRS